MLPKVKNALMAVLVIGLLGGTGYFAYNTYVQQTQITGLQGQLATAQVAAAAAVPTEIEIDIDVNTAQTGESEEFSFAAAVTADGNFSDQSTTQDLEITNTGDVSANGLVLTVGELPDDLDGLDEFQLYVQNSIKSYIVKNGDATAGFVIPDLEKEDDSWTGTITMELDDNVSSEDTLENNHEYEFDLEVYSGDTLVEDYEITMQT